MLVYLPFCYSQKLSTLDSQIVTVYYKNGFSVKGKLNSKNNDSIIVVINKNEKRIFVNEIDTIIFETKKNRVRPDFNPSKIFENYSVFLTFQKGQKSFSETGRYNFKYSSNRIGINYFIHINNHFSVGIGFQYGLINYELNEEHFGQNFRNVGTMENFSVPFSLSYNFNFKKLNFNFREGFIFERDGFSYNEYNLVSEFYLFKNVNKKIAAGIGLSYLMNTSFQQIFPVPLLFSINLRYLHAK